jgi:hypothetical protein
MRSVIRGLNVAALVGVAAMTVALAGQTAPQQRGQGAGAAQGGGRGPRMGKTSPFVGTWNLNVSKSTYENVPPEQRRSPSTRTIDIEGDGTFTETHRNKTGGGREGFYHWHGVPGGPAEIVEYGRNTGDLPGNKLTIKLNNDHQWGVTFRNQQNQIVLSDTWTVSPDNKTLTIDRHTIGADGQPTNHSVEVFDNDGWAMPRATQ